MEHLKLFHGIWSIVVALFFITTCVLTIYHFATKKDVTSVFRRISFYATLTLHIQAIVGVVMLFMNPDLISSYKIQGSSVTTIEHLASMLTVVLLVTIFNAKIKRNDSISGMMLGMILLAIIMSVRTLLLITGISILQ